MNELQTVILRKDCPGTYEHVRYFKRNIVNIFHVDRSGNIYTQKGLQQFLITERTEYIVRQANLSFEDGPLVEVVVIEWELDMQNPINCEP
jgi:hypothetical protein